MLKTPIAILIAVVTLLGGFYSGSLDQFLLVGSWHPSGLLSIDFSAERDLGRVARCLAPFALGLAVRTLTPLDNSSAVTGLGGTEVALRFTWLPRPAPRTAKE